MGLWAKGRREGGRHTGTYTRGVHDTILDSIITALYYTILYYTILAQNPNNRHFDYKIQFTAHPYDTEIVKY